MVTIGQIYESLEKYQKDDYYLKGDDGKPIEPRKIGIGWEKMGAAELKIDEQVYKNLKAGKHAITDEQLIQSGVQGGHRGGYDACISYDKSVSVWAASSPDNKKIFQEIRHAVQDKVTNHIESNLIQCRYGHDGIVEPVKTGNLIGILQEHGLGRDLGEQAHDHLIFFNQTHNGLNNKWQALHSDAFKNDVIEKIVENEVAYQLQQRGIAVTWVQSETGKSEYAGIAGIPDAAREACSPGAARVNEYFEEHKAELMAKYQGESIAEIKHKIGVLTRPDKISITPEQRAENFDKTLEAAGITKDQINQGVQQVSEMQRANGGAPRSAQEIVRQAYRSQQDYESVFSRADLIKGATTLSRGEHSLAEIETAVKELDAEVLHIEDGHVFTKGKREYSDTAYTTTDVLQADQRFAGRIEAGQHTVEPIMTAEQAQAAIAKYQAGIQGSKPGWTFTSSQDGGLNFLLTNDDRYKAIQGYAGTAKTSTLSAYQAISKEQGYDLIVISESNTAVNEAKAARCDKAYTTTKFLHDKKLQDSIGPKTIVLSDETSFTGSFHADRVTEIVEAKGARAEFWGDKDQHVPISAGHPFHYCLSEGKIRYYEMINIVRQKDPVYREAVYDIIKRDVDAALDKLDLREINTAKVLEVHHELAAAYNKEIEGQGKAPQISRELQQQIEARQQDMIRAEIASIYKEGEGYKNFVVPVTTNNERNELNEILRNQNIEAGKISREGGQVKQVFINKNLAGEQRFLPGMYRPGDKLISQKGGAGISVGKAGIITKIDTDRGTATVQVQYKDGPQIREVDLLRNGDKFLSFESKQIEVAPGEKIIFNQGDRATGIANSDVAYVISHNPDGSMRLDYKGKEVTYSGEHYEQGYAWTGQRVQGKTAYGTLPVDPRNHQALYVGTSRGEYKAAIVCKDREQLAKNVATDVQKEQTWKYEKQINTQIRKTQRLLGQTVANLEREPDAGRKEELTADVIRFRDKLDAYQDANRDIRQDRNGKGPSPEPKRGPERDSEDGRKLSAEAKIGYYQPISLSLLKDVEMESQSTVSQHPVPRQSAEQSINTIHEIAGPVERTAELTKLAEFEGKEELTGNESKTELSPMESDIRELAEAVKALESETEVAAMKSYEEFKVQEPEQSISEIREIADTLQSEGNIDREAKAIGSHEEVVEIEHEPDHELEPAAGGENGHAGGEQEAERELQM